MTKDKNIKTRGRPKLTDTSLKRDKRLPVVQVSENELEAYKTASKLSGMTFSAWVRDALDKASN